MKRFFLAIAMFFAVCATHIAAQPFALSPKTEIPLGAGLLAGEIFHNVYDFTVADDDWDGVPFDKDDVNAFDRPFMHAYNKPAARTGDAMMVLLPAGVVLFNSYCIYKNYALTDLLTQTVMAAETLLMAHTIPHIVKPLVMRTRPYNYYAGDEALKDDWNRSFFSGHTTMAFAAATFGTYTYCKWFPESNWKIPVAAISYSLAAFTGISRLYAGCHFTTDVLVGAVVGSAVGFLVPWVHTLSTKDTQIALSPAGFSVTRRL